MGMRTERNLTVRLAPRGYELSSKLIYDIDNKLLELEKLFGEGGMWIGDDALTIELQELRIRIRKELSRTRY